MSQEQRDAKRTRSNGTVLPVEPKLPVVVAFEKWWLEQRGTLEMSDAVKFAAWNGWLSCWKAKTTVSETACREQIDFAIEKEACRWAERLNWIHAKYDVDGSGTESGDALDVIEAEIRLVLGKLEEQTTPSAIRESEPDEDGERYRWFRNECSWARRSDIVDVAAEEPDLLDHHIDKGRCGL